MYRKDLLKAESRSKPAGWSSTGLPTPSCLISPHNHLPFNWTRNWDFITDCFYMEVSTQVPTGGIYTGRCCSVSPSHKIHVVLKLQHLYHLCLRRLISVPWFNVNLALGKLHWSARHMWVTSQLHAFALISSEVGTHLWGDYTDQAQGLCSFQPSGQYRCQRAPTVNAWRGNCPVKPACKLLSLSLVTQPKAVTVLLDDLYWRLT